MGIWAVLLVAVVVWSIWTGRLRRMTGKDGLAFGIALFGAVLSAKGKLVFGLPLTILPIVYQLWRSKVGLRAPKGASYSKVHDVAYSYAILGLPTDAKEEDIRAAHRRLIASVHPDKGGTEALAAEINAARDRLLQHIQDQP